MDGSFGQAVATAVMQQFCALPKKGKPQPNEHTVLAGFVITQATRQQPDCRSSEVTSPCRGGMPGGMPGPIVVSLGTGTKCLGRSQRSAAGDVLNDSHAEVGWVQGLVPPLDVADGDPRTAHARYGQVIARRALLRWLYQELQHCPTQQQALKRQAQDQDGAAVPAPLFVALSDGRYQKQGHWELHMFISQLPCGDACIFPGGPAAGLEQLAAEQPVQWHRTGAKRLRAGNGHAASIVCQGKTPEPAAAGPSGTALRWEDQQVEGALRRKPGRGDPTLSFSCRCAAGWLPGMTRCCPRDMLSISRLLLTQQTGCPEQSLAVQ